MIEDTAVRRNDNILSITFCVKNNNVILYDTNGNTPEGNFWLSWYVQYPLRTRINCVCDQMEYGFIVESTPLNYFPLAQWIGIPNSLRVPIV